MLLQLILKARQVNCGSNPVRWIDLVQIVLAGWRKGSRCHTTGILKPLLISSPQEGRGSGNLNTRPGQIQPGLYSGNQVNGTQEPHRTPNTL